MIFQTLLKESAAGPLSPLTGPAGSAPAGLSLAGPAGSVPAGWSFLAYLDVWLIGGLVLLAVVVVVAKWLRSQWHRRNEAGDPEYYDGYNPYYDQEPESDFDRDDYRP